MSGGLTAPPSMHWHALAADEALDRLDTGADGLTTDEAGLRLSNVGPNTVDVRSPVSAWRVLSHQFASVVVGLLVGAAILALALGDFLESAAIGAVLFINVTIGFWSTLR